MQQPHAAIKPLWRVAGQRCGTSCATALALHVQAPVEAWLKRRDGSLMMRNRAPNAPVRGWPCACILISILWCMSCMLVAVRSLIKDWVLPYYVTIVFGATRESL